MEIKAFFDKKTFTLTYIVWDPETKHAIIIDPVLDYDPASSTYSFESVNEVYDCVEKNNLNVEFILETHAHADHISGSQKLKELIPNTKIAIGENITKVQKTFKEIFNLPDTFPTDGSQFDKLIKDSETIQVGNLSFKAIYTPGHTEACYSYSIDDAVFTGDALFMPDFGVARCDFPNGSAETLYKSVTEKLYSLPDRTRVFTAHDYQPGGRELKYMTTIEESKKQNIHINSKTTKEEFIEFRTQRDRTLSAPKLLLPSIQININAGKIPEVESNETSYLKIPIREKK